MCFFYFYTSNLWIETQKQLSLNTTYFLNVLSSDGSELNFFLREHLQLKY